MAPKLPKFSFIFLLFLFVHKHLPRYLPRDIVPRTASSRAQLSAVIATVFDMTVRPLPLPTLRPAPFLDPPRLFGVI
jgi:hypothetical protein